VSAAAWLPEDGIARVPGLEHLRASAALVRIEEFTPSVAYRLDRLRAELAVAGATILDDQISRSVWKAIRDAQPLAPQRSDAVWRVSVRPSGGPAVLAALRPKGVSGFLDWGGGLVWLAGPAEAQTHAAIEAAARATGGTWTLMRAPDTLRGSVRVVPDEPSALARITREVKAALDPAGILNPGRFYPGL
jgi:glycolate oxidase FAD binding subunit